MPLKFEATYVCHWVRQNNGVVQSIWVPADDRAKEVHPILINTPIESGVPKVGETGTILLRAT